jgi:hypothetical protein
VLRLGALGLSRCTCGGSLALLRSDHCLGGVHTHTVLRTLSTGSLIPALIASSAASRASLWIESGPGSCALSSEKSV